MSRGVRGFPLKRDVYSEKRIEERKMTMFSRTMLVTLAVGLVGFVLTSALFSLPTRRTQRE